MRAYRRSESGTTTICDRRHHWLGRSWSDAGHSSSAQCVDAASVSSQRRWAAKRSRDTEYAGIAPATVRRALAGCPLAILKSCGMRLKYLTELEKSMISRALKAG